MKGDIGKKFLKEFDEAAYHLFVRGFIKKFTIQGDVRILDGEFIPTKMLGLNSIDYIKGNRKILKELFGDKINLVDLEVLIDNAALTARRQLDTSIIEDPVKNLPGLTIGSYVGRFNAWAQGRTGVKYLATEAMVVQLKRNELDTMAGLLLNPKATERIADIIREGKPLSGSLVIPETVWLPRLMGEIAAWGEVSLDEGIAGEWATGGVSQDELYSNLPKGMGTVAREQELLNNMQQKLEGD
jgi:hypothetical protein